MKNIFLKKQSDMIPSLLRIIALIGIISSIHLFLNGEIKAGSYRIVESNILAIDDTIKVQNGNEPIITTGEKENASNKTLVIIDGVVHKEKNAMQNLDPKKSYITTFLTDQDSIKKYTNKKVEAILVITSTPANK